MRSWTTALQALTFGVLFSACAAQQQQAPPAADPPAATRERWSHPPVINGSRRACLEPPYTPPPDATTLSDGTPARRSADGLQWTISLQGDTVPQGAAAGELIQRVRTQGDFYRWLSWGVYCDNHTRLCLHYAYNLCEQRLEDVVNSLRAAIAQDPVLPRPIIDLNIELAGRLGPRCDASDPACVPEPYQRGTRYDPSGQRIPGPLAKYSSGTCGQDGDCVVGGCGNDCMSWELGGAYEAATCEGYSVPRPIFCGCVSGQCRWFMQ